LWKKKAVVVLKCIKQIVDFLVGAAFLLIAKQIPLTWNWLIVRLLFDIVRFGWFFFFLRYL